MSDPESSDKPRTNEEPSSADLEVLEADLVGSGGEPRALRAVQVMMEHRGPLPSEQWLASVEQLHPGTTQKIVDDFVAERAHQREMQLHALGLDRAAYHGFDRYQTMRLAAAWSVVVLIAAAGIVFIAVGRSIYGLVLLASELAVLSTAFFGRRAERQE